MRKHDKRKHQCAHHESGVAALFVLGAVTITALAGLTLAWLRVKRGGIWASVAFHAGLNSLAMLAAIVAHAHVPPSSGS